MKNPPKILVSFLRRICKEELFEAIEGDLFLLYNERLGEKGKMYASWLYFFDVIQFLQPFSLKLKISNTYSDMYKNYLKIIFRNILKKKLLSGINLLGMSLAIAIVMVTFAFVSHESGYDQYHSKKERVYRVSYRYNNQNGYDIEWARVNQPWVNEIKEVFPEVEEMVRFQSFRPRIVKIGEHKFKENYAFATDAEVFKLFDFEFLSGDAATALESPFSVVLTESIAKKYFGKEQAMDKEIVIFNALDHQETYKVTAIIKDQPTNTHLPVTLLSSINSPEERRGWAYTYLLLKENAKIERVEASIASFITDHVAENPEFLTFSFQPVAAIHLNSALSREIKNNGNMDYLIIFSLIALFLLIIATINFANLNTVQLLNKTKEIGVRKVIGAGQRNLRSYVFLEAFVLTFISAIIGSVLFLLVLKPLENFIGYGLIFDKGLLVSGVTGLVVLVSFLASVYPAQVISRLRPILALKGKLIQGPGKIGAKTFLVGLQFALSAALVSGTLIFQEQFRFIQNTQLGYNQEQVLAITDVSNQVSQSYETLKAQIKGIPGVRDVTATMEIPTRPIKDQGMVKVTEKWQAGEELPSTDIQIMDTNALDVLDIELIAGEKLPESIKNIETTLQEAGSLQNYMSANRKAYLINEEAVKTLGFASPSEAVGKEISWTIGNLEITPGPVVGVIKNFHQESLKTKIDPLVITYEPFWLKQVLVKLDSEHYAATIDQIEEEWNILFPDIPIQTTFLDSEFEALYKSETKQFTLVVIITAITVFIAFLGVFGLIAYTVKLRLREMAIRKVMGAKFIQLFALLGKKYVMLNLVSMALAIPLVWYFMNSWLENYAYHIQISPFSFGVAVVTISIILLATIYFQTRKATTKNPTEILRNE